ncbi:hypothetical protein AB0M46_46675 [Dactylosporangium sp. NPDC051485]|uniref:hypothetical protein n=1 Tax=Dactylosporangium sp. NPDC051485 TaxID=3154846 RepID=UPI00342E8E17
MRRLTSTIALGAAAIAVTLAVPTAAHAATISQPFAANSGDSCHYGSTSGTLTWTIGPSPLPAGGVPVSGKVSDRPLPADPGAICLSDGYSSTVTFTAYSGTVVADQQSRTADNGTISFSFTLAAGSDRKPVSRIVVQVCRNPVVTLPPSYCGPAVTYPAPTA